MDIASTIRSVITKRGLPQKVVAERCGFTEQQFTDMLKGRKLIRAEYIPRIASVLGCTPNDLYPEADEGAERSLEETSCPRSKFEITTDNDTITTFFMNGQDITENAISVIFKHAACEPPTVTIEYLADECTVRTLGELIIKKKKT